MTKEYFKSVKISTEKNIIESICIASHDKNLCTRNEIEGKRNVTLERQKLWKKLRKVSTKLYTEKNIVRFIHFHIKKNRVEEKKGYKTETNTIENNIAHRRVPYKQY